MKNLFKPLLLLALAGTFTLTSCTKENPEIGLAQAKEEVAQLARQYYTPELPAEEGRKMEAAIARLDGKQTELLLEAMHDEEVKRLEKLRQNPVRKVLQPGPDGNAIEKEETVTEAELSTVRKEIDRVLERKKQAHGIARKEHGKGWFQLEPEQRNQIAARILGVKYEPPVASARIAACQGAAYCPSTSCPTTSTSLSYLGILVVNQGVRIFLDDPTWGYGLRTGAGYCIDGCDGQCDLVSFIGYGGQGQVCNITASGRTLLNLFGGAGRYLGRGFVYKEGETPCGSYGSPGYALWGAQRVTFHYLTTEQTYISSGLYEDVKYRRW